QRCKSPENIYRTPLHTFFVDEGDVAILHLDGNWNQNSIGGDLHKIRADIKGHWVQENFGGDDFLFQIFELDWGRSLQFCELLQPVELFALQVLTHGAQAEALHSASGKALRLVSHSH